MADRITSLLRWLPDQTACEVMESDVYLIGGGAFLQGMSDFLAEETDLNVRTARDPMRAVINGIAQMSEDGFRAGSWPRQSC
jgi:actin-like ATPase involved in cell morphogenesis